MAGGAGDAKFRAVILVPLAIGTWLQSLVEPRLLGFPVWTGAVLVTSAMAVLATMDAAGRFAPERKVHVSAGAIRVPPTVWRRFQSRGSGADGQRRLVSIYRADVDRADLVTARGARFDLLTEAERAYDDNRFARGDRIELDATVGGASVRLVLFRRDVHLGLWDLVAFFAGDTRGAEDVRGTGDDSGGRGAGRRVVTPYLLRKMRIIGNTGAVFVVISTTGPALVGGRVLGPILLATSAADLVPFAVRTWRRARADAAIARSPSDGGDSRKAKALLVHDGIWIPAWLVVSIAWLVPFILRFL